MANQPLDDSPPPLVLLANDQEWSARSLETVLGSHGFAAARAFTGRQALELAQRLRPDVVIADVGMPDISGIELCQRLRDDAEFPRSTPIIVTTAGPASRAQRLDAYRAGAWEFLSQPIDSEALLLKLQLFVRARREIDRSREASLVDDSTGMYNVRGLARRAREIGADASRRHSPLACVAVGSIVEDGAPPTQDLDARLADHVSEVFRRTARSSDAIGRLGRGEFAVIGQAMNESGALKFVERFQRELEASPTLIDGVTRRLKVRAGYCAVSDFAQSSFDAVELLLRAASALRQARAAETVDGSSSHNLLEVPIVP